MPGADLEEAGNPGTFTRAKRLAGCWDAPVEAEVGCARFRPEEVAAAGTATRLPASFEHAERVGKAIVAKLCEGGARPTK